MSSPTLTLSELKQLIVDSLQLEGIDPETIEDDAPLFGEGLGLDSVDALELVVALEKRLGVKIRTDDIDPQAFANTVSLHGFIQRQVVQPAGTSAGRQG